MSDMYTNNIEFDTSPDIEKDTCIDVHTTIYYDNLNNY